MSDHFHVPCYAPGNRCVKTAICQGECAATPTLAPAAPQASHPGGFVALLREEAARLRRDADSEEDKWMAAGIEAAADTLLGIDSATGETVIKDVLTAAQPLSSRPGEPAKALQALIDAFDEGRAGPLQSSAAGYVGSLVESGRAALAAPPQGASSLLPALVEALDALDASLDNNVPYERAEVYEAMARVKTALQPLLSASPLPAKWQRGRRGRGGC